MISPADDFAGRAAAARGVRAGAGHGAVVSAELAVSSLGVFEAYLNGRAAGPDVLSPGWSSYEWRLRYRTYDVTDLLQPTTVLGISLGNGWSRGRLGWNGNRAVYGDRLAVIAQVEVAYADGHRQLVITDETWRAGRPRRWRTTCTTGRPSTPGWPTTGGCTRERRCRAGAASKRWIRHQPPHAVYRPACHPAAALRPVAIWSSPSGRTLVDFGQNLVGWLRFTIQGEAGTQIIVRHGEVLEMASWACGRFAAPEPPTGSSCPAARTTSSPPRPTTASVMPRSPAGRGQLTPRSLEAVVVHSDLRRNGQFECSDPMLNLLHSKRDVGNARQLP